MENYTYTTAWPYDLPPDSFGQLIYNEDKNSSPIKGTKIKTMKSHDYKFQLIENLFKINDWMRGDKNFKDSHRITDFFYILEDFLRCIPLPIEIDYTDKDILANINLLEDYQHVIEILEELKSSSPASTYHYASGAFIRQLTRIQSLIRTHLRLNNIKPTNILT